MQNPYSVKETESFDYQFTTKDGIKYRAYFISAAYLHPLFTDVYSFNIEPEGDFGSTKQPIDPRIGATVYEILRTFFRRNQNSMLMACDNTDGREGKRKKRFDRWFNQYNDGSILKLDAALESEIYNLYVSMYIS